MPDAPLPPIALPQLPPAQPSRASGALHPAPPAAEAIATPSVTSPPQSDTAKPSLHDQVVAAIRRVYDPEIPVNIYELGLIYGIEIDPDGNVKVRMTLTSPACPAAQELPLIVRGSIERVPEVKAAEVEIVFDPPWTPQRMTDAAKVTLGMM
jgi:FeS assembly SUF system protein